MGHSQSRFRERESGLSVKMKNVGMSLKGIITGGEKKAMGGMTLPYSSWNDSKTLMQK